MSILVNKVDAKEWKTEDERASYEISLRHTLGEHFGADFGIIMLPWLSREERDDFQCNAAVGMRAQIWKEMERLNGKAKRLVVTEGALEMYSEKYKREMHVAKKEKNRQYHKYSEYEEDISFGQKVFREVFITVVNMIKYFSKRFLTLGMSSFLRLAF